MVSTLDSESSDPSSNLGRTFLINNTFGKSSFQKDNTKRTNLKIAFLRNKSNIRKVKIARIYPLKFFCIKLFEKGNLISVNKHASKIAKT